VVLYVPKAQPELLDMFNQTNRQTGLQSCKMFSTIGLAAAIAVEQMDFPTDALETICQRHCGLVRECKM
jgi:hemoglobin-like flavoprotein